MIFRRKYRIKRTCENCSSTTIIKIPLGTTIKEWVLQEKAKCQYCGCWPKVPEDKKEKPKYIGDELSIGEEIRGLKKQIKEMVE